MSPQPPTKRGSKARDDEPTTRTEDFRPESQSIVSASLPEPVIVVCVVMAAAGLISGSRQLLVVSAVVLIVVGVARAWARLALSGVELNRTLSTERAFAGDTVTVELTLENRKALPLPWLNLNFTLPDGLRISGNPDFGGDRSLMGAGRTFFETFSLGRFERIRARRTIMADRRGVYRLGAATVESGDLFGFYATRGSTTTHQDELVVFPVTRPLPGFSIPPRTADGESAGRAALHEDTSRPKTLLGQRLSVSGGDARHTLSGDHT